MKLFVKQEVIDKLRQRNKFRRECIKQARYWRENPDEYIEKILGLKLHWYQKVLLKIQDKIQNKFILMPYRHGRPCLTEIANAIIKALTYK